MGRVIQFEYLKKKKLECKYSYYIETKMHPTFGGNAHTEGEGATAESAAGMTRPGP